jgi:hypothetical protein
LIDLCAKGIHQWFPQPLLGREMKVAIGARLLAKGDMDVDASHGVEGTLYDHEQTEQMASKLVLYH